LFVSASRTVCITEWFNFGIMDIKMPICMFILHANPPCFLIPTSNVQDVKLGSKMQFSHYWHMSSGHPPLCVSICDQSLSPIQGTWR
jgi:hypothetical protein